MPQGLLPATVPMQSRAAPPSWFRAAEGVRSAWPTGEGPFGRTPRRGGTRAQKIGLAYESKVLAHLSDTLGAAFCPLPWFKFTSNEGMRFCQPDGIFVDPEITVIFETKYSFTADAYWQLKKLYEPVIRAALKPKNIGHVIVCRRYDPLVSFPEKVQQTQLLAGWHAALHSIGVYEWRP